jgi:truncated hemoglobin YjbI
MSEETKAIPTLLEWMGGMSAIERLMRVFYRRVPDDALLASVFAQMAPEPWPSSPWCSSGAGAGKA